MRPLLAQDWTPERLVVTPGAAWSWHPDGISNGRLAEALDRAGQGTLTARNWATLLKLQTAAAL